MENCQHGNFAPVETLKLLPHSQAGIERHKCVVCAYQGGLRMGIQSTNLIDVPIFPIQCKHGKSAPEYFLLQLPESQAGTGRHKCAVCAFYDGFKSGLGLVNIEAQTVLEGITQIDVPHLGANPFSEIKRSFKAKKVDYKKEDNERTDLGRLGEELVIAYERKILLQNHLDELASKVVNVAITHGDGAGYDVLSFTPKGKEKFIEVKTTTGLANVPFYMSANELEFSKQNSQNYYLYRVFALQQKERRGKFFQVEGDVSQQFHFDPITYRVSR